MEHCRPNCFLTSREQESACDLRPDNVDESRPSKIEVAITAGTASTPKADQKELCANREYKPQSKVSREQTGKRKSDEQRTMVKKPAEGRKIFQTGLRISCWR